MDCKHKWIDVKDGTRDKLCLKCGKKAMQGQLQAKIRAESRAPITQPMARKQVDMPLHTGDKTVIVKVYKDDLIKEINKSLNLSIINSPRAGD